jgi:hypothetical protein
MLAITVISDETSPLSSMVGTVLRLFVLRSSEISIKHINSKMFAVNPLFFRNDKHWLKHFNNKTFVYIL